MNKKEKVILPEASKLGEKFEVKELKRGFVVNYLLPRGKVILYNKSNLA
jgi:ribosomal protein L9